jgi:hypothetical protein
MIIPFKVEICFHYTSNLVLSHSTLSLLSSKLVTITVQKFLVMSEPIEEILDHESKRICNKYIHVTVINSKHYRMYNTTCKSYENKYIYVLTRTSNKVFI